MSKIKFIIAGITIAAVSLFGSSLKAEAAEWGVDMNLACRQQHGSWAQHAYIMNHNAYGWRCKDSQNGRDLHFGRRQISVANYCSRNHGGARAVAKDPNNPYSWRCIK